MGVTINKRKNSGDWYVWISHNGKRTSRKIGPDRRTALKSATEYRKKLALGEVDFSNGRGLRTDRGTPFAKAVFTLLRHLT